MSQEKKTTEQRIEECIQMYTEKYAKEYGISLQEARQHIAVKLAAEYYHENPPKDETSVVKEEIDLGCGGSC